MEVSERLAMEYIRTLAKLHKSLYDRDVDALQELGEVDMETVLGGYLWARVQHEFGLCELGADEELEEVLSAAIIDFYCEQMDF